MEMPEFLLTLDVETTSISRNGLFDDMGQKVITEGLPPILDMLDEYSIKSTFFYTGYIAKNFPKSVKIVHSRGHEIGSHGLMHQPNQSLDILSLKEQVSHLKESKKILEDMIGEKILSFRAPALRVNGDTPKALMETGFTIDSSIASQRFDMFLSFGSFKKLNRLIAPRTPYFTSENSLAKKGKGSILEIPISAIGVPYIGTTLRIFPKATKILRYFLGKESICKKNKPIVFLFHPNENIREPKDVKIERRVKNAILYILGDVIRRNLKMKNLGHKGMILLNQEINYFKKIGFQFITLKTFFYKYHS